MKTRFLSLLVVLSLFGGCTKNNQNDPASFAYLNVNQTFLMNQLVEQAFDIDNDGQVDWMFTGGEGIYAGYPLASNFHFSSYLAEPSPNGTSPIGVKILPYNYLISSNDLYEQYCSTLLCDGCSQSYAPNIIGTGDFYIGFKSQNAAKTNSFYGWARLNFSFNGQILSLTVKDMAMNKVNGGSINAGQY